MCGFLTVSAANLTRTVCISPSTGQDQRIGLGNPLSVCVYVFVRGCEPGASRHKVGFAGEVVVVPLL